MDGSDLLYSHVYLTTYTRSTILHLYSWFVFFCNSTGLHGKFFSEVSACMHFQLELSTLDAIYIIQVFVLKHEEQVK